MWRRIVYRFACIGAFLVLDLRLYYLWSRLGRWLYQKAYLTRPIRQYADEDELQRVMSQWVWMPDPFWELGDMISTPAYVEARGATNRPVGDCDDFSVYAGEALAGIVQKNNGLSGKAVREISLLTIPWVDLETSQLNGHNVCVFQFLVNNQWYWAFVSNWFKCEIQWAPGPNRNFKSPQEIASFVCATAKGENTRYARVSLDLRTVYETGKAPVTPLST